MNLRSIEWMSVLSFSLVLLGLALVVMDQITELQGMLILGAALVCAILSLRSRGGP